MSKEQIPYLCGGTLFNLLLTATYKKKSARERAQGISDNMSDRYVMNGLVYAVTGNSNPSIDSTLKKDTSKYKECHIPGSINIPFNDPNIANSYRDEITYHYDNVINRMTEFVRTYIDDTKYNLLGKYLLAVIEQDNIPEDEPIYYCEPTSGITKSALRTMTDFEIQALLIGIMRYILDNRRDNNGRSTLDMWRSQKNIIDGKLSVSSLSESINRKINVKLAPIERFTDNNNNNSTTANDNGGNIDDSDCNTNTTSAPNIQIIQNPTIYNQHADKIYNIEHLENLD